MTIAAGTSRRLRQCQLDDWLRANRGRLERESSTAIALELRKLGFYSAKTVTVDIRSGVQKRCSKLGIPFKGSFFIR